MKANLVVLIDSEATGIPSITLWVTPREADRSDRIEILNLKLGEGKWTKEILLDRGEKNAKNTHSFYTNLQ
ncbi:MAG: hypothetical protein IE909_13435 [Campylobacterales bacterium]|nr:hypothetical protein [Campylobacterales bacterium]